MQIHPLAGQLSVAAQIDVADIATLAAQGFRSIINNRPDGEVEGQPASALLEVAARQAGLNYRHIPVVSGQLSDVQMQEFADALDTLPRPVLAFCRTGTRSTMLWALQANGPADTILQIAREAGYDLSALHSRLSADGRGR
ncbi:MAG TPA: TIGR01244 family sulfur transferase [Rhodanobacter sp.]|nr:TIGR01244 family sulfur transferase [Rhodanobacter sp.]